MESAEQPPTVAFMLAFAPLGATTVFGKLVPLFEFGNFFFEIHGQGL